jgi:hypothetical protein
LYFETKLNIFNILFKFIYFFILKYLILLKNNNKMNNLTIIEINNLDPTKDEFERIEIQFVPPALSYNREATLAQIEVVGRNNPTQQWTGGNTSLSFKLDFFSLQENREDVMKKVRWLQSLTYRREFGQVPLVKVAFGKLFLKENWFVKSVNVELTQFNPAQSWLPQQAYVDLTLQLNNEKDLNFTTIRNNL